MNPRKFILGSDWWTDCDDAVAIRLFCNSHKQGKVQLLGIVLNACMPFSAPSLDVYLQTMGLRLPIALDRTAENFGGTPSYQEPLSHVPVPRPPLTNEQAEDPVRFYRRMLSQYDQVELADIGFPQALTALLKSGPDDISPLSGMDLVRTKVPRLWIMAGKWDADGEREHNFCLNPLVSANAAYLCGSWPGEIIFLGWEAGYSVITGSKLPADDPLKTIMKNHGSPNGRSSWDPMLVHLAVCGDCAEDGYTAVRGTASVRASDGANFFRRDSNGKHAFVVKNHPDEWYAARIDAEIGWQRDSVLS